MSFDIVFFSRTPIDHAAIVKAATRWANRNPNFEVGPAEGGAQLMYNNRNTLVHAVFDVFAPDADEAREQDDEDEETTKLLAGLHPTGCSANFNYLRPAFFADELVPLAVGLAKEIGAVLYDPQDGVVSEPDAFAATESYLRHLRETNARFIRDPQHGGNLRQVSSAHLQTFWRHNVSKPTLQETLGEAVFVPTMLLGELKDEPQPTTVFIWTRALPLAFEPSGNVLLQREVKGWFKSTLEFRLTRFDAFREALTEHIRPLDGHPTKLLLQGPERRLETAFDRLYATLPPTKEIKDAMPSLINSLMSVVDAVTP